jgi:HlyD family secretion protein
VRRRHLDLLWVLPVVWGVACGSADEIDATQAARVERGPIRRIVVATGTIEPEKEIEIRPRIAGIVETVYVHDGDEVRVGQPLIEIERDLLASQMREAKAALEEAEVERRYAEIDLERSVELEKSGATSQRRQDDAQSRFERSKAQVARARAQLDTLSTELSYATVRSPLAGRVLRGYVEEGSAVSPVTAVTGGSLLFSLAATDAMHLEGMVDENEVAHVAPGQTAYVRTEAFPERSFKGVVSEIAPVGKRIQNVTYFEVKVEIVDPDVHLLRPRMSGDAEIVTETVEDAVIVPETALHYRGDQIFVEVVERDGDRHGVAREVKLGIAEDARVQVLGGLEAGERVTLK